MQVSLHPQYERVLNGIISVRASLPSLISARLAFWVQTAERLQANRSAWLDSLPESARILHSHTGLHGPLLNYMHKFLVSRGYPDLSVAAQACEGFPSTGILARSHIWPEAPDKVERIAKVSPVSSVCADLRSRLNRWEACRSKDPHTEALLKKHLEAVRCGREREVSLHDVLSRPAALIHPCFGVKQGAKLREIMDCSAGGLNSCHASAEKLVLPGVDDILDFACRLHQAGFRPVVAVADERSAFRNWPTADPSLHIAAVLGTDRGTRLFEDRTLSFGDGSSVYSYNRVRCFLTAFLAHEFLIPCWNFFDDSGITMPEFCAPAMWHGAGTLS